MSETISDRQRRERSYYDQYAKLGTPSLDVDLAPVLGRESRPWNSYWFFYQRVRELRTTVDQHLLDFGCGSGNATVLFATLGYEVSGFDISPNNVDHTRRRAERYGLSDRVHTEVGVAEQLPYPNGHFDVIAGIDVLHHVDIPRAIAECRRVLKPGGSAIFHEPVVARGFDTLRNTWMVRQLVPNTASFERHVTEDERKLDPGDLATLRAEFPEMVEHRFWLLERLTRLLPGDRAQASLARLDQRMMRRWPATAALAGVSVLELRTT